MPLTRRPSLHAATPDAQGNLHNGPYGWSEAEHLHSSAFFRVTGWPGPTQFLHVPIARVVAS